MQVDLAGQVALVTGGTRGIGAAISRGLLDAGATVHAVYAGNEEAAASFEQAIEEAARCRLTLTRLDVADHQAVQALFERWEGPLQVVVNNAGIRRDALVGMMAKESWDRVLEVDLSGPFHLCKFAVRRMIGQRYGRIINISSPAAERSLAGQANYAAAKAGLVAMTRSLAREVATRGITVNCVSPGFVRTEMLEGLAAAKVEQLEREVPMGRFGTPEEIAAAVLFVASPAASYLTGATIPVTGGL